MKNLFVSALVMAISATAFAGKDEDMIKKTWAEMDASYNKGDMKAMMTMVTDDVTVVNPYGMKANNKVEGRSESGEVDTTPVHRS